MADNREAVGHGRLSVVRTDADDITVLGLDGEIDHQSVGGLTRALSLADAPGGHRVVIDLSGVTFMDSSGVNALIAAFQSAQAAQGWLRLVVVRGAVLRTLQLVGLDTVVPCHPTLEEALASAHPGA
ncbi:MULTISPECIES: STAS domain-containing protein [Streptomyces]|uniref:STAS domain-containing protein n=1 Tax=Streptomyces TaxID=1883 RepID=UPI003249F15E|nr:STAS domain-containing protein [Streptomyces canus]WSZ28427.1 STAS domain-containing protein [Streptomyces sp. NBC_00882]WSZ55454.1 STAS domain-containing protein [Streptomyces canus]